MLSSIFQLFFVNLYVYRFFVSIFLLFISTLTVHTSVTFFNLYVNQTNIFSVVSVCNALVNFHNIFVKSDVECCVEIHVIDGIFVSFERHSWKVAFHS
jgi:hypothetical protein